MAWTLLFSKRYNFFVLLHVISSWQLSPQHVWQQHQITYTSWKRGRMWLTWYSLPGDGFISGYNSGYTVEPETVFNILLHYFITRVIAMKRERFRAKISLCEYHWSLLALSSIDCCSLNLTLPFAHRSITLRNWRVGGDMIEDYTFMQNLCNTCSIRIFTLYQQDRQKIKIS